MYFSPKDCTVMINGRYPPLWNSFRAEHANDRWTGHDAGNGQVYDGENVSARGDATLVLPMVNGGFSAYLESLLQSGKTFPITAIDKSDSTRRAVASQCRVKKSAPFDRQGSNPVDESWGFVMDDLVLGSAGAPENDIQPLPTGAAQ